MPRIGELKVQVFLYVKSIKTGSVKDLLERRSRIKICISDLQPDSRNLMENPDLIKKWDIVKEAVYQEDVALPLLFDAE